MPSIIFTKWNNAYTKLFLITLFIIAQDGNSSHIHSRRQLNTLLLFSHSFMTPWTSLSIGFSRQEYWSRLPFPPAGDLSDPGIEPMSPALAGGFFTTEPPAKPKRHSWAQPKGKGPTAMFEFFNGSIYSPLKVLYAQMWRDLYDILSVRKKKQQSRDFGGFLFFYIFNFIE